MEFKFSQDSLKRIEELKRHYPEDQPRAPLLMVLHIVQEQFGYVPQEMVEPVAESLGIPKIWVEEVVTFYPLYRWEHHGRRKFGKNHLGVCVTLSCHLGGAPELVKHVQSKYGVTWDGVNDDGTLSMQEFQCLGSCHTTPAILFNDLRHESVGPAELDKLLAAAGVKPLAAAQPPPAKGKSAKGKSAKEDASA